VAKLEDRAETGLETCIGWRDLRDSAHLRFDALVDASLRHAYDFDVEELFSINGEWENIFRRWYPGFRPKLDAEVRTAA
jgi:hypothetical protein